MAPALADTLDSLAQRLSQAAGGLRTGSLSLETDQFQRMGLIKAGTELIDAVSLPKDKFLVWLPHFTHITALRLFIKWKAFTHIPVEDGAAISYTELAGKLGADVSLISKFHMGVLASVPAQAHGVPSTNRPSSRCKRQPQAGRSRRPCAHRILQGADHAQPHLGHGAARVRSPDLQQLESSLTHSPQVRQPNGGLLRHAPIL